MYRKLLLCTVAFSLVATPALADPVSVGSLVIAGVNALLGTSIVASTAIVGSITLAGIVGSTVLTAASFGLSLLLGSGKPGQQQQIDPSAARQSFETGNSGQWRAIGRAKIGGVVAFGNTNAFDRYRLILRCKGPIDAIETTFLGNREVTVEPDGSVSSPPFARLGGSWVNIQTKVGDGTETAWPALTSAFPTLWTADHRVRGIAQTLVKYTSPGTQSGYYLRLYGSGYPDCSQIGRWEKLYDPRSGSYAWSDNGVLGCLHILLDQYGFPHEWFDMPFTAAEATKAEMPVPVRGGGTEPRSRCWGTWEEDSISRGDLLEQVLRSTGCELVARPGDKIGIALIDDDPDPEVSIAQRHILNFKLRTGPEGVERPNVCKVRYYAPERGYEMAEIPLVVDTNASPNQPLPWSIYPNEIARVGRKETKYDLPFCPSASQAQRIARRLFAQERAEAGIVVTNLAGLGCWGARVVEFEHPDFGTLKCRTTPPRVDDDLRTVEVGVIVMPELDPWSPETDEALPPIEVPEIGFVATVAQPSIPTGFAVVTSPVAGVTRTRMAYGLTPSGITAEATIRTGGALPGPWQSMTEANAGAAAPPGYGWAFVTGNLSGQVCEGRLRHFNLQEDGSDWSPVLIATPAIITTAPGVPTITAFQGTQGETSGIHVQFRAPADLHVAGILKSGAHTGTVDAVPLQDFNDFYPITADGTYTFSVQSLATGGAQSALVSATVTIITP